jgi:hypothetical protein
MQSEPSSPPTHPPVKIAALIRAYHRPDQLDVLLDRLSGDLWSPYVHIDGNSDIRLFDASRAKAVFLPNRVPVYWGGLSQVEAVLRLLRAAFADPTITHFYHMSGQCYPVKTDGQIRERLRSFPVGSANLMEMHAMPVSHKPLERYTRRWLHDIQNPILWRIFRRLFLRLPDRRLAKLRGIQLYGGGCWWLFEREAVAKILTFLDSNRWYWRLFKHTDCPDEMLLHTLMAPLGIHIGGEAPTGDIWVQGKSHPETITEAMHQQFVEGPALFARKYVNFHPALPRATS